jgi:hypothetical protein
MRTAAQNVGNSRGTKVIAAHAISMFYHIPFYDNITQEKFYSMYPKWGHASSCYMPVFCSVTLVSIPGQVDVGFVMNELALGQVSVRKLQVSTASIIQAVHLFLIHLSRTLCKFSN